MAGRVAAAIFVLVAIVGCGESSSEPQAPDYDFEVPSGQLTKAEYESAFQAIYEEVNSAPNLSEGLAGDPSPEESAMLFRAVAAAFDESGQALDALRPPKDIAREHQGFVENFEATEQATRAWATRFEKDGVIAEAAIEQALETPEGTLFEVLGLTPALVAKRNAFLRAAERGNYDLGEYLTGLNQAP